MKCTNCGKEIADDSKFCEFCGAKTSITRYNKKVDIRWALLPAMVISIFAICIALAVPWAILLLAIPPIILFIISLVNGIKKTLEPFFVIIMGILLVCVCLELYAWVNRPNPALDLEYYLEYWYINYFFLNTGIIISIISLFTYLIYVIIKNKKK